MGRRALSVLVTGALGQVGRDVVAACRAAGDDVVDAGHADLDVSDRDAVIGAVTSLQPDAVIHTAAWTAVDACESDPDRAHAVNALAVRWVAEACRRAGAHLVHLSTDYVFDGTKPAPYVEWDAPNPLGVYGTSKRWGEWESGDAGIGATVVRTSWVCGDHGSNMVATVRRLLAGDAPLRFVTDQRGCPTFAADLAPMLRWMAVERLPGVYHVTNQGAVTWYEFVREAVGALGGDVGRVEPITTAELQPPRPARRPANSVLDNAALRLAGRPLLRDFRPALAELVERMRS